MISLTHFVFGLTLAYLFDRRLVTASAFSLVPDFDITFNFLYPFVHRGIMHSFLAAAVFSLLVWTYTESQKSAESCFLGYSGHLGLDLLTASGVPLFFPFLGSFALDLTSAYSLTANLGIISACTVLFYVKKNRAFFRSFLSFR